MRSVEALVAVFGLLASSSPAAAADGMPKWMTEGPYVASSPFSLEVPLEMVAGLPFVDVEVGGAPRRFLFDTGSPSMMSADLAAELGLEAIDKRRGRDSHGAIVDTDIVQSDLTVGGTTFRKVPVFVADFPKTAKCLFDGVLGSEVLPLCAWQIDLPGSALRCSSELAELGHLEQAGRQPLHDLGYPHAPILDVRFAKNATSKALFDTGSPDYMSISRADFEGAGRNGGIGETIRGSGSIGASMGGRAPDQDQLLMQLKTLSIGNVRLDSVGAVLREASPSLIGASILEHFVVTLDARTSTAWFDRYRGGPFSRASYGFGLGFDDGVRVSYLWEGSPAEAAGLHVGQRVKAINGRPTDTSCDGIRHAMRAISDGDTIELEWDGGAGTLARERAIPD